MLASIIDQEDLQSAQSKKSGKSVSFSKTHSICFRYSVGDSASSLDNKWSLNPMRCNYWSLRFTEESRKLHSCLIQCYFGAGEKKQIRFSSLIKEHFQIKTPKITTALNKADSQTPKSQSIDTKEVETNLWQTHKLQSKSTSHVRLTTFVAINKSLKERGESERFVNLWTLDQFFTRAG